MKATNSLRLSLFVLLAWMSSAALAVTTAATTPCSTDCSQAKNTWHPRAFSSYSMHDIVQRQSVCKEEAHKINFTFLTEYMQNFNRKCSTGCKNLGSMPFWSGDNTLTIGNNDGKAQLDAYQLGMGNVVTDPVTGIAGKIQLDPRIQHVGTDTMMMYEQNKDERGLFFKVHAPLGAMIINPRLKELTVAKPDGVLSTALVAGTPPTGSVQSTVYPTPKDRQRSVSEAFYGSNMTDDSARGNINRIVRLRKARIGACKQSVVRMADVSMSLGYNAFVNEKGFFGVAFKGTCPTGNVPQADYMLEPIFGRGGVWGLGGELSGAYKVWENDSASRYLNINVQGEVLHLMPGRTPSFRTFDLLLNGKGSKYLLVQEYLPGLVINPTTFVTTDGFIARGLKSASDITTLPVFSKFAVEGSVAMLVDFHCNNWNAAVGAEFWGRSRECLSIDTRSAVDLRHPDLNDFAVIGRQFSAYHVDGLPGSATNPVQTNLCEPKAKINQSQSTLLLATSSTIPAAVDGIADASLAINRIPSKFSEALDIAGAAASRAMTGKVTGQVGYTWTEREHMPSVVLSGGAEFTNKTNNAIQLWNVALTGSLNF